jgi:PadR family transcriptional regulator, regulatory protein PadR
MLPCVRRQPRDRLYRTAAAAPLFNYLAPDQSAKGKLVRLALTVPSSNRERLALFDFRIQRGSCSIRMSNTKPVRVDLFRGTLDAMILQTLETLGPLHGYAISERLEQISSGLLQLNMGTLYPGLMRLEQRGFVHGRWGVTDSNRRARFYELTARGRRQLLDEREEWDRMAAIMNVLFRREA